MNLPAIVLAIASGLHRGTPPPDVVDAIVRGCEHEARVAPADPEMCAALVTTYAGLESGYSDDPRAWSWDAAAGVSCGLLQLPCRWRLDPARSVRAWLTMLRRSSLASVDSSCTRARRRLALAESLLRRAR